MISTLVVFQVISSLLLQLQPIVSRPIPKNSGENQDAKKRDGFRINPPSGEGHFRDPLEILAKAVDVILCGYNNTVLVTQYDRILNFLRSWLYPTYDPDKFEKAGEKFPESKMLHLCKANLYMFADIITEVTFPMDSSKLCGSVCKCYQESMYLEPGVTVSLIHSTCDYTGDTILEGHPANETHAARFPDMSTACVCAYNVRCNRKTKLVKYTLTPNERGFLRVSVADCELSGYVT